MGGPHRSRDRGDRTLLIALAAVLLIGWLAARTSGVLGAFTDAGQVTSNVFTTDSVGLSASPASGLISLAMMSPGDVVTAPIAVTNTETTQLRYAVTSTTSENSLSGQLDLYVKSGVSSCTTGGFGASGSMIYNNTNHLGSTTGVNLVGNPSQGAHAGDRVLAGGAGETLCFQVSMPTAITSAYQGLSVTATFTFEAEQVANN
jgi:hypothetical protein